MDAIPKIVSIFGLSWFSFWPAMPAGIALGLNPLVVIAVTTISYISGVALVLLPGERFRAWIQRRYGRKAVQKNDEESLTRRMWRRYGVIGFGIIAPMTVGAQIGAMIGLALNVPRGRLLVWMSIGALLWSILLTIAVLLGVMGANSL
jgi:hypothetical protein